MRAEDLAQKRHAGLHQQHKTQSQCKWKRLNGLSQIRWDARAEEVGQPGEEEVERTK